MITAIELRAVLFDLDGTLLDTAPDMCAALNALRGQEGLEPVPLNQLRCHVSHGAARLISVGFGCGEGPHFEALRQRFLDLYRADLHGRTRLFDGLEDVLQALESAGTAWGVVTNKPAWLTDPLLRAMGLTSRAACVVSGDTTPERKPHPMPLLHAAGLMQVPPAACVYVGDAERDIQAGRAAGMRTLIATFGYISQDEDPATWEADAMISHPRQILDLIGPGAARKGMR